MKIGYPGGKLSDPYDPTSYLAYAKEPSVVPTTEKIGFPGWCVESVGRTTRARGVSV